MTTHWKSFWPVLPVLLLGIVVPYLLADSPGHALAQIPLAVLLWSGGWLYCAFSNVRRSAGAFTAGAGQFYLALAVSLFPQLFQKPAAAGVLGLSTTMLCAMLLFPYTGKVHQLRTLLALIIAGAMAAALPFFLSPRFPQNSATFAVLGLLGACVTIVLAWIRRQSRGGISRVFTVIYFAALIILFTLYAMTPANYAAIAETLPMWLTIANILLGVAFIADQLTLEQWLRSGAHMDLEASLKDPLTNLANRRALEIYGPQLIAQSQKAGRAISMIMADIDHFKQINDTHGHLTGDTVLKQTAARFVSQVRKSDMVARYGGEEFIIMLPGSPLAPALRLAERIRATIAAETVQHENVELSRTVSFGVATAFPEEPMSLADLIKRADTNLYRAKREGRNLVRADALPSEEF